VLVRMPRRSPRDVNLLVLAASTGGRYRYSGLRYNDAFRINSGSRLWPLSR